MAARRLLLRVTRSNPPRAWVNEVAIHERLDIDLWRKWPCSEGTTPLDPAEAYAQGRCCFSGDLAGLANRRAFASSPGQAQQMDRLLQDAIGDAGALESKRRVAGREAPIASGQRAATDECPKAEYATFRP